MNTILVTTQIVAYGVGIVSASLNIAGFVRRAKLRRLRGRRLPGMAQNALRDGALTHGVSR